jgi:hypothetical protein
MAVRRWLVPVLALIALSLMAAPALGAYHLMKIREVGTGNDGDYVELQMYSSGQTQLTGHRIKAFNGAGAEVSDFPFPGPVSNGDNQRTILFASAGHTLSVTPDFTGALDVVSTGGTVCFMDTPTVGIDCVSWGTVTPPSPLPSPVGAPAPALTQGQSLERTIAPGCATLLENSDDTDDSAADFSIAAQSPRPNSVTPTETTCSGGGGGGADNDPPQTTITKGPKKKSEKTKAKFKFKSDESSSTFQCAFDKGDFKQCKSPKKYKRLDPGKHKFFVRAIDKAGNVDPTPAKRKFKVLD